MKRRLASVWVVVCLGLAHAGPVQALQWVKQTVDSAGDVGLSTSLALDSGGRPHISYYDATNHYLKYAHWSGSAWAVQSINSATWTSLALDSLDRAHIGYQNYTSKDLNYSYWNGSSWTTQVVDIYGTCGQYNSLKLDGMGNAHISYVSFDLYDTHRLMYAHWTGSAWAKETVAEGADFRTSLALDPNDNPSVAYFDKINHNLVYTYRSGTSWVQQIVDSANYIDFTSLALDADGLPRIAY